MAAELSKLDKAALLLAVVGEEYAAGVFKYLHHSDVQKIGQAMKQTQAGQPGLHQGRYRGVPAGDHLLSGL